MADAHAPEDNRGWPAFIRQDTQDWYTQAGWTSSDWNLLYLHGVVHHQEDYFSPGRQELRAWMRNPPSMYPNGVTPADTNDAFTAYGSQTPEALNARAAGASARFVAAFMGAHRGGKPEYAWAILHDDLGLVEAEATGWAATRYLSAGQGRTPGPPGVNPVVTRWRDRFGPTSYLYVLGGYDIEEATTMQEAGTPVSEQQLRVMVALRGIVLPAGI